MQDVSKGDAWEMGTQNLCIISYSCMRLYNYLTVESSLFLNVVLEYVKHVLINMNING